MGFFDSMATTYRELQTQRIDDHRYYHHCRINQSLHLLSACSFVLAYILLFIDPAVAGLLAWLIAMTSRQAGHFFFEPKTYDDVNQATHAHKEEIKVGYNLHRKVILMSVWLASPVLLVIEPTLFGTMQSADSFGAFARQCGLMWLALGVAGLLFRVVQLCIIRDVATGLVWALKIVTDPFHDIKLYWRSPYYLLRGQRIDPMDKFRLAPVDEPTARRVF
jgi:hypothetical protein